MAKKKIKFDFLDFPITLKDDDFLFQWCCDCGLRHFWHFIVVRGNKPEKDEIYINCVRDDVATDLRKFYEKAIKEKKAPKGGK
jgi:hypothetical protein